MHESILLQYSKGSHRSPRKKGVACVVPAEILYDLLYLRTGDAYVLVLYSPYSDRCLIATQVQKK